MTLNSKFLSALILLNIAAPASAEEPLQQVGESISRAMTWENAKAFGNKMVDGITSKFSSSEVVAVEESFWVKAVNSTKSGFNTAVETAGTKITEGTDLVSANKNKAIIAAVVVVAAAAYAYFQFKKNKASDSDDNA